MAAMQVFQLVIGRSFVKSLSTVEIAGVYQISRVLFRLSRSGRRSVDAARLQVTIIVGGVEGRRERSVVLAHGKTRSALKSSAGGKANPRFLAAVLLRAK